MRVVKHDDNVFKIIDADGEVILACTESILANIADQIDVLLGRSDDYLHGKLAATELHLKDMRRLVLLEKPDGEV